VQPAVEGFHQGDHGRLRWFNNGPCEGGGGRTPVHHNGLAYARDFVASNEILDADTGKLLGTFQAGPAPAFAGGIGLYPNGSTLRTTGGRRTLWRFSGDGGLDSAPIVVEATVVAGSSIGLLIAVDAIAQGLVHACGTPQAMPRRRARRSNSAASAGRTTGTAIQSHPIALLSLDLA
jgi:PQQ-like domain